MALCLNREGTEYSTLLNRSGIPGFKLDVIVSHYLEKFGRFPKLHEIPGSDSSKQLISALDIKKQNIETSEGLQTVNVSKQAIHEYTGKADLQESRDALNFLHSDLQIDLVSVSSKSYKIKFRKVPTKYDQMIDPATLTSSKSDEYTSVKVLNNMIDNLFRFSGSRVHKITDADLAQPQWSKIVHGKTTAKAFVYNGEIYINVDHATIDDRFHELLHIVLGGVSRLDPDLYMSIIQAVDSDETKRLKEHDPNYKNKSYIDVLEEVLVQQVSKHITGQHSIIQQLDANIKEKLFENIAKALDRALTARNSATTLNPYELMDGSLYNICRYLGERTLDKEVVDNSQLHRQLANTREQLIKSKKLEEECN